MAKFMVDYTLTNKNDIHKKKNGGTIVEADSESAAKAVLRKKIYFMIGHPLRNSRLSIRHAKLLDA